MMSSDTKEPRTPIGVADGPLSRRRPVVGVQTAVEDKNESRNRSDARKAGTDAIKRLLLQAVNEDPEVRDAVRLLVAVDVRVAVDEAENRLGERIQHLLTSVPGQIGQVIAGIPGLLTKATDSVSEVQHPRAFKLALVAILALFCGVIFLLVQNVRDITVRNDFRGEMAGMVDQAAQSVLATSDLRDDINSNQTSLASLLEDQSLDNAFRHSYEAFDFPSKIDDFNEEIGGLRMEMADMRREMDEKFDGMQRGQDRIRHRVAPIEAVALTNRTRFYRSDVDRLAGTHCTDEPDYRVRRAFANWHVRSCTDGYNGVNYRLYCAQLHKGQSPDMSYSSCTSTSPNQSS
jgi:hypothetical protein